MTARTERNEAQARALAWRALAQAAEDVCAVLAPLDGLWCARLPCGLTCVAQTPEQALAGVLAETPAQGGA